MKVSKYIYEYGWMFMRQNAPELVERGFELIYDGIVREISIEESKLPNRHGPLDMQPIIMKANQKWNEIEKELRRITRKHCLKKDLILNQWKESFGWIS